MNEYDRKGQIGETVIRRRVEELKKNGAILVFDEADPSLESVIYVSGRDLVKDAFISSQVADLMAQESHTEAKRIGDISGILIAEDRINQERLFRMSVLKFGYLSSRIKP